MPPSGTVPPSSSPYPAFGLNDLPTLDTSPHQLFLDRLYACILRVFDALSLQWDTGQVTVPPPFQFDVTSPFLPLPTALVLRWCRSESCLWELLCL